MSDVKTEKDGSVGIVTRADVAGARQQAQETVKDAEKLRDETLGAEGAQQRAEGEIHRVAKDIDGVSDGAEGLDVPPPEEVDVWGVDTETGQPIPRPGTPPPLPGQGGPLQPGGGTTGAPGQPQPGAPAGGPPGAAPRMRHLPLPSMYPGTRRRTPGALPTVQPAMWARGVKVAAGVVGTVAGKVDQVGRRVAGVTAAYMAQHIIRAPGVADRYDQEIARQIAALGMSTPHNVSERWKVDKSPGWGTRWDRAEGDNTIAFRRQMNTIRDLFQMTGNEYLAMTRELGPYANQRRAVVGTAMIAREYGITGAQAGRFQRTFAEHTDIGRRRAYSTTEAQQPIGHFMEFGGMRDRAGLFMDDAAGFARSMADGQGAADSSSVLGYTAWLGSIGLGTRGDIGRRLLTGASRHGGDMIHALKIRAVQTFLSSERVRESSANGARTVKERAGFTLGAGRTAVHLDTRGSLFDAELAIGSKDPRLLPAYKRMSQRLAREHGGLNPQDYAMTVFGQMAGVGPAQVKKVWNDLGALDDVDLLSRTPEKDVTWTQGPYHDDGGKDGKSSGAVAAAMDLQQHAMGHGMNYLLRSVNEGLTVAVAGMQANRGFTDSLLEGLYTLDPDLLKLGALAGGLQGGIGGRTQAAIFGGVLATRDVVNLPKNVSSFTNAMHPASSASDEATPPATASEPQRPTPPADAPPVGAPPAPSPTPGPSGLVIPVPGSMPGQDLGAPRYRFGKFDHAHNGLDFFAPVGTPVNAAGPGEVISVRNRKAWENANTPQGRGAGIMVKLRHADGTTTSYMHLDDIAQGLKRGDRVEAGQRLGSVGRTGIWNPRTGSHLHFEVRDPRGTPISPSAAIGIGAAP